MKKEKAKTQAIWNFILKDIYTGKILSSQTVKNTIVDNGLERWIKMLIGLESAYFRVIAIGTGITGVVNSDAELEIEYTRELATLSYESAFVVKLTYTFSFGSGVDEDISEAGIFDSDVVSGSTMFNRVVITPINVITGAELITTVTITLARA